MFKEFKDFISRGNVMDLAVGVVIGAAFGKIISSFVNDVLMPPIGMLLGKVDFSNLFIDLSGKGYSSLAEAKAAGAAIISYGSFMNNVVDFIIVAFALFIVIKPVNRLRAPTKAPATKQCTYCLSTIPDAATRCPNCTSTLSES